jgi:hypothetical protein
MSMPIDRRHKVAGRPLTPEQQSARWNDHLEKLAANRAAHPMRIAQVDRQAWDARARQARARARPLSPGS